MGLLDWLFGSSEEEEEDNTNDDEQETDDSGDCNHGYNGSSDGPWF